MLIPVAEAQARLFALADPVATETLPVTEAAGRWAAADVRARRLAALSRTARLSALWQGYGDRAGKAARMQVQRAFGLQLIG